MKRGFLTQRRKGAKTDGLSEDEHDDEDENDVTANRFFLK
jgi:hypothetical protein